MFSMLQRHDVQVLVRGGVSQRRIREVTGVSERTIRRIAAEPEVGQLEDRTVRLGRCVGRPSKTAGFREFVRGWLRDEPELKAVELLHRMRARGYTGGRTAAYTLVASLRQKERRLAMRFEGLPGEFTQHDFGEVVVKYADGRRQRVHFFATRLKYSRWVEVTLVPNQKTETLVRVMIQHFARLGGIPLLAVFDRPKTVALKWLKNGTVSEWNPTFARAMFELGLGVELCWPYQPQQKGSVENLVGWAKGSFFTQRRFLDYEDLVQQLAEWVTEVNTERPSRATGVTPAQRLPEDRRRLRPLRTAPEAYALRFDASVGPTGEVSFEDAIYTVDPTTVGLPATLFVYPERIRIVAGRHEIEHERQPPGGRSTLPEHRARHVAAVSGRRGKRYLKRQHLLELGDESFRYLSEVVHRRPTAWATDVEIMHGLLQEAGDSAVKSAISRAAAAGLFGGEYIRWFIDHATDAFQEAPS
jgi:transposase